MSYVQYKRPFSAVGFRPYRKTTPFAAAHGLAGLGDGLPSNDTEVPGTGQTVGDLLAIGYSVSDIMQLLNTAPSSYLDATPGASQPSPTVQAGVPNGSTLLYTASIGAHLFGSGGINDFLSAIAGALTSQGIQVVGSNSSSAGVTVFNIQLQLLITGAGYGKPQDVQAVVDHAVYTQRGEMPLSSSINVIGLPGSGSGLPGSGSSGQPNITLSQWFQKNGLWLALGLVGVIVIGNKI